MGDGDVASSFSAGKSVQERCLSYVPDCYVIPTSHRPSLAPPPARVPTIDMAKLSESSLERSIVIEEVRNACHRFGFFQVINQGISQELLDEAISVASEFFNLPTKEKMKLMSNDVHKPVRYGTSFKDGVDKIQFWRVFLKHHAHPLDNWVHSWPDNPPHYRESMGKYCQGVMGISLELIEAITESLKLGPKYMSNKLAQGMQIIKVIVTRGWLHGWWPNFDHQPSCYSMLCFSTNRCTLCNILIINNKSIN